jgi:hypothetical protein
MNLAVTYTAPEMNIKNMLGVRPVAKIWVAVYMKECKIITIAILKYLASLVAVNPDSINSS